MFVSVFSARPVGGWGGAWGGDETTYAPMRRNSDRTTCLVKLFLFVRPVVGFCMLSPPSLGSCSGEVIIRSTYSARRASFGLSRIRRESSFWEIS